MDVRDARRARVEIMATIEGAELGLAARLLDPVAAADRPDPAADPVPRLQHGDVPAGLAELVGRNQSGDAGAENDDLASPSAGRRQFERLRVGRRVQQPHRLHAEIDRAVAADRAKPLEEEAVYA